MDLVVSQMSTKVLQNLHTWVTQQLHLHVDMEGTKIAKIEAEKEELQRQYNIVIHE
jgi:hypothetical protein